MRRLSCRSVPSTNRPPAAFTSSRSVSTSALIRASAASRRSEEHTSELQSLMRTSYAVFCLKKKIHHEEIKPPGKHQHALLLNEQPYIQQHHIEYCKHTQGLT